MRGEVAARGRTPDIDALGIENQEPAGDDREIGYGNGTGLDRARLWVHRPSVSPLRPIDNSNHRVRS